MRLNFLDVMLDNFTNAPEISFKVAGENEKVEGKIIVFSGRTFAIEERWIDEEGAYHKEIKDHFEINVNKKIKNYEKALKKEIMKHLNPETKVIYMTESVAKFLEILGSL